MNNDPISIEHIDGKEIMEGLKFKSAVRVKEEFEKTTWLVEMLAGGYILIEATEVSWPGHQTYNAYRVFEGNSVNEFANKFTSTNSPSHHLLTQLV